VRRSAQYPYDAADPELRIAKTTRVFRAELDACVAQIARVDADDALWAKVSFLLFTVTFHARIMLTI
jgi:hypothetical protein